MIYQLALTFIKGVGDVLARQLLTTCGSAEAVFKESPQALQKISGFATTLARNIKSPEVMRRAEEELRFIEKHKIRCYFIEDDDYPLRLKECPDAPILFYFKGQTNLNATHALSIVGTRHATPYGKDRTKSIIRELAQLYPDLLIVSGLAYGIDVTAHQAALSYGLPTVAVLAHGLDRIYPQAHKQVAREMLTKGGLLSDYPTKTRPDRANFVKRNRIVAGLTPASLVVESAEKGGSLITANIAFSYSREVLAIPGRVTDPYAIGCNRLIQRNKAALVSSAEDIIKIMNWDLPSQKELPKQGVLLFEEKGQDPVLRMLAEKQHCSITSLAMELNIPLPQLATRLFDLQMEGKIRTMPGNEYCIIL